MHIYDGNVNSSNLVANLSSGIQSYKFTSSGQLLAVKIEKGNRTEQESYKIILSYVLSRFDFLFRLLLSRISSL